MTKVDMRTACPVAQYARRVVSGREPAGGLVRLACERHLRDLEEGPGRGLSFDRHAAERAIGFFEILRQIRGKWAGMPLSLSPWQKFIVGSIFGWKKQDGTRRFREAYVEIPRKNGKSTMAGGAGLYAFLADGEQGAQVYSAATKYDQAAIVFKEAHAMVRKWPSHFALRQKVKVSKGTLIVESTNSVMMPLSADKHTLDGLNPHMVVIDELHAHRDAGVYDVLNTALGAREQPLLFSITTAGYDRESVCWKVHHAAAQMLEGVFEKDSLFAYIATIDEGDDPMDPAVWAKANPNLGVSVNPKYMEEQAKTARTMPSFYNTFLRLHLNVWTQASTRWIDQTAWEECSGTVDVEEMRGRPCFVGTDIATRNDVAAMAILWPPEDFEDSAAPWHMEMKFWVPEEAIKTRSERDGVPYDLWADQGFITATPGNMIDQAFILAALRESLTNLDVQKMGFDPWNATMMMQMLMEEGAPVEEVRQGYQSLSGPSKFFEELIMTRRLRHGGNPVLRWMAANCVVVSDPNGNIRPAKDKSTEKIDGIAATLNALALAMNAVAAQQSYTANYGVLWA